MQGSCWVYLFIADTFPSIFWWRKSPVELCLAQMCPLGSEDDGGARRIGNLLQEARKFDWNVTLIHKIWSFPAATRCWRWSGGGERRSCFVWNQLACTCWATTWSHPQERWNLFFWSKLWWFIPQINQQAFSITTEQEEKCCKWMTDRLPTLRWKTSNSFESKKEAHHEPPLVRKGPIENLKWGGGAKTNPRPEGFF